MKLFRIFYTGMFVSFLGTLPLGTLNVAAMQISVGDGIRPAIYFSLGCLLVEMIYVRISLVAMYWVRRQKRLFRGLEWLTLVVIAALAVSSFVAAASPHQARSVILSNTIPRFLLGAAMSAINPVQIPFWFGWSTILFARGILGDRSDHYNSYIAGIGIGTLAGNCVFIFGGQLLVERLNTSQQIINWTIGGIFAITALIQLWRMLRHQDASENL